MKRVSQTRTFQSHVFPLQRSLYLSTVLVVSALFAAILYTLSIHTYYSGNQVLGVATARIDTQQKVVALTFDDGPSPTTETILNTLKEYRVMATFFVLGTHIDSHPHVLQRIDREGHDIGNHTNTHLYLPLASTEQIAQEILITEEKIKEVIGRQTSLFRAPYGWSSSEVEKTLSLLQLQNIGWDVDPKDWKKGSSEQIAYDVIEEVKPGSIILLHDGPPEQNRSATVKALPIIIRELRAQGYTFVKVSELITISNSPSN